MKILLLAIYLMSGPVRCSDVIGYSRGDVSIHSNLKWDSSSTVYICKVRQRDCVNIISSNTTSRHFKTSRFTLDRDKGFLKVTIRHLTPRDSGEYRISVGSQYSCSVKLDVDTGITTLGTSIHPTTSAYKTSAATVTAVSPGVVCYGPTILISVCACVVLLLIEGFVLILYKLCCKKTQDSTPTSRGLENNKHATSDYENDLPSLTPKKHQKIRASPIQQNPHLYSNQSYSAYQSLSPKTQIHSVYHTLQLSSKLHSPVQL